jgi:ribosomal protein L11 methyltransferase
MPTYSALTTLPGEEAAQALASAMERMTPNPPAWACSRSRTARACGRSAAISWSRRTGDAGGAGDGLRGQPFALSELPEVDWVAHVRRELSPVDAGRFFVFGSHDADKVPAGRVPLQIEATVAFGTGHHGTTLGCLLAFDRLLTEGWRPAKVADIGCGTAVLAMAAAATLPEALVIASDIDRVAVDVAEANVAINGLDGRVECLEAAGLDHARIKAAGPYDLIFANILKGPLIELAPAIATQLATGGRAILSGLLSVQADSVTAAYEASGLAEQSRRYRRMVYTLVLQKLQDSGQ